MQRTRRSDRKGFRSGELAKAAGVSRDTLRHYERKGILPKRRRSAGNYREYPPEALERVQVARRALALGFTLDELSGTFRKRDAGGIPCRQVRDLAARKLAKVETTLGELLALRDSLRLVVRDWDAALAATAPGRRARLLDSLPPGKMGSSPSLDHSLMPLKRFRKKGESGP